MNSEQKPTMPDVIYAADAYLTVNNKDIVGLLTSVKPDNCTRAVKYIRADLVQNAPATLGRPAVFYCENGKSLDGLEQGALAVLSNMMIKSNATSAEFMIGNEEDGEFYFTCSRVKQPTIPPEKKS